MVFRFMDATSKAGWPTRGRQKANDRKILFVTQGGWIDAQGAARRVRGSEKATTATCLWRIAKLA
jgi:hypothetical protein